MLSVLVLLCCCVAFRRFLIEKTCFTSITNHDDDYANKNCAKQARIREATMSNWKLPCSQAEKVTKERGRDRETLIILTEEL